MLSELDTDVKGEGKGLAGQTGLKNYRGKSMEEKVDAIKKG